MANGNFIVQNGLQVGPLTIFSGNGDVITTGNLSSAATSVSFDSINNTPIGNSTPSTGAFTTLTVSGAQQNYSTISASAVYAGTIGNTGATLNGNSLTTNYLTGGTLNSNITLTGSIIPSANLAYDLGTPTAQFRHVYIGPGTLYINGKAVLQDNSGTITVGTSSGQNLSLQTGGGGILQLNGNSGGGGGYVAVQSSLQIGAGNNITSSDGNAIQFANEIAVDNLIAHTPNANLQLNYNGTGIVDISGPVTATGAITTTVGTSSTNSSTGALVVQGGAGITGAIYAGSIQNTPIGSTTASTGAFTSLSSSTQAALATAVATNFSSGNAIITGGSLNGTPIGATSASTGTFTTSLASNVSSLTQLTSVGTLSNYGTLNIGGAISYGPDYGLIGSFVANIPNYAYVAVQNLNTGGNASASFTAYNNTGTSYIDMGVNSSNFNATASGYVNNSVNQPNASYAYSYGGDMVVGTWGNNGIHFITNATTTVGDSMFISGNGNVYISGNLTVTGQQSQYTTITTFLTESANLVSTAYLSGNASTNSGTITLENSIVPGSSNSLNLGSISYPFNSIYGTIATTSQNSVTTMTGLTSIGTLGSLTVSGTATAGVFKGGSNANPAVPTNFGLQASGAYGGGVSLIDGSYGIGMYSVSGTLNFAFGSSTSITSAASINSSGVFSGTATTANYADLAENYLGDKFYNPGTVVMFGGTQEVTLATADTTAVAGVVSTNPAHLMNGALQGSNVAPVALQGRVPCQVVGPVAKGDIMVSAGFGYAKVNNTPQIGQVIGKALQDFPIAGKGVIEVVVGRF